MNLVWLYATKDSQGIEPWVIVLPPVRLSFSSPTLLGFECAITQDEN
jgi:hypothetical protein